MSRISSFTTQIRRDLKRMKKRGKDIEKIKSVFAMLVKNVELPEKLRDHKLSGDLKNFRECHIEPDWLLVYHIDGERIRFERTGTHSDLFD